MSEELAVIVDADPAWPEKFRRERDALAAALDSVAVRISHVGSTSIAGLAAKPVIDICVEASVYPPSAAMDAALAALGYLAMGESGVAGRHFYRKGAPRAFHLHLCPIDGAVALSQLRFKRVLLARPELAARYAALKRSISGQHGIDRAEYVRLKEPIIREILDSGI